jgi:vancomycin resistance protein YoaR
MRTLSLRPARFAWPGRALVALGGLGFGVLLLVLALAGYRLAYRERIFPGVVVAGVALGGATPEDAAAMLQQSLNTRIERPLVVEADGHRWELSRARLGARYNVDDLARSAYAIGRSGGLIERWVTPVLLRLRARELAVQAELVPADWNALLAPIARQVDQAPVDARLVIGPDHRVSIAPERDGRRLDLAGARRVLSTALIEGGDAPVSLPVVAVPPAVRASDLSVLRDRVAVILSAPVRVNYDGRTWTLDLDRIQSALILPPAGQRNAAAVRLNDAVIASFVERLASEIDRPVINARLRLDGERVVIQPSAPGRTVDRAATAREVQEAILGTGRVVQPVVSVVQPTVTEDQLRNAATAANRMVSAPIDLHGPDGQAWTLTPDRLRALLQIPDDPIAQRQGVPRLDPAKLAAYVADLASQIDRAPSNARFQRLPDGRVQVLRDGQSGQALDQERTVQLIETAALSADTREVSLPVAVTQPSITAADAGRLTGLPLLVENATSYAGSIPPRRHNVELAASLLNGVVVGPGEMFSFNRELGPTTLDRGFQVGFGIVAQGNTVKTVPSVGGGICQVATTLFQPVFWMGFEIDERYPHAYWIAHYASHGYPGLDTTVDDQSGLDFRFRNGTAGPLLIQAWTDGTNVHFALYGPKPDWTVRVDPPVITNVVRTDRTVRVQYDPTMPKGQQVYTEAAEDGFTVVIHRVVTTAQGEVRELNLRSTYAPSHNVLLVGIGPA